MKKLMHDTSRAAMAALGNRALTVCGSNHIAAELGYRHAKWTRAVLDGLALIFGIRNHCLKSFFNSCGVGDE